MQSGGMRPGRAVWRLTSSSRAREGRAGDQPPVHSLVDQAPAGLRPRARRREGAGAAGPDAAAARLVHAHADEARRVLPADRGQAVPLRPGVMGSVEVSVVVPVYGCDGALPELHRRLTQSLDWTEGSY